MLGLFDDAVVSSLTDFVLDRDARTEDDASPVGSEAEAGSVFA